MVKDEDNVDEHFFVINNYLGRESKIEHVLWQNLARLKQVMKQLMPIYNESILSLTKFSGFKVA